MQQQTIKLTAKFINGKAITWAAVPPDPTVQEFKAYILDILNKEISNKEYKFLGGKSVRVKKGRYYEEIEKLGLTSLKEENLYLMPSTATISYTSFANNNTRFNKCLDRRGALGQISVFVLIESTKEEKEIKKAAVMVAQALRSPSGSNFFQKMPGEITCKIIASVATSLSEKKANSEAVKALSEAWGSHFNYLEKAFHLFSYNLFKLLQKLPKELPNLKLVLKSAHTFLATVLRCIRKNNYKELHTEHENYGIPSEVFRRINNYIKANPYFIECFDNKLSKGWEKSLNNGEKPLDFIQLEEAARIAKEKKKDQLLDFSGEVKNNAMKRKGYYRFFGSYKSATMVRILGEIDKALSGERNVEEVYNELLQVAKDKVANITEDSRIYEGLYKYFLSEAEGSQVAQHPSL